MGNAEAIPVEARRRPVLREGARETLRPGLAAIAQLPVRRLVTTLRAAVGQPIDEGLEAVTSAGPASGDAQPTGHACGHGRTGQLAALPAAPPETPTLDADALLESGTVPLGPILAAAGALPASGELRVLVAFRPAPIVERLESLGFACEFGLDQGTRSALRVSRRPGPGSPLG